MFSSDITIVREKKPQILLNFILTGRVVASWHVTSSNEDWQGLYQGS